MNEDEDLDSQAEAFGNDNAETTVESNAVNKLPPKKKPAHQYSERMKNKIKMIQDSWVKDWKEKRESGVYIKPSSMHMSLDYKHPP